MKHTKKITRFSWLTSNRVFRVAHVYPSSLQVYSQQSAYATAYDTGLKQKLQHDLKEIEDAGLYKRERTILSPQSNLITTKETTQPVLNFCANNYLGLANNPTLIKTAQDALTKYGLGMASVRFICGTQDIHKQLEQKIADFHKTESTILYTSCWDANGGIFEILLNESDAVFSDALNHASIIDGIRLCKARKLRYKHLDLNDLEQHLKDAADARVRLIVTDGAFSMDGDVAPLNGICDLAEKYNAIVMVDDSHATGFFGPTGRGTPEFFNVMNRVDIVNSTLGKALGGSTGGYTTGRKEIVDILRQRSRPYLFSNSLAPCLVSASIQAFDMLSKSTELRDRVEKNTTLFRSQMKAAGFNVMGNDLHPIAPILLGDARLAGAIAEDMLKLGVYVVGFSFPVVPKGEARIRVQLSAVHTEDDINKTVKAFIEVGKKHKVI